MDINHSLIPNPIFASTRPILTRRPHGVPTREGTTATGTGRSTFGATFELADTSRSNQAAFQRALVGDPFNDEQ